MDENNKNWDKKFKEFWKPLLTIDGKYDEQKIKNEMHDLDFATDQISELYMELTGGRLSKPMYYAQTILQEHNENFLNKGITQDDVAMFIKEAKDLDDLKSELNDYFELESLNN